MAYTEILSNRAGLRNQTYTPEGIQLAQRNEIDASSQFGRGIRSAGLQEEVGFLADSANNAYRNGDTALAQALELQMQDKAAQAQQWAPTTQNFTDINSVGTAMDWATGSLGQGLRSTLLPAAGSLVGAGAGALTGIVTKNPALGAKVGANVGGFLGGYNMEANETIASAMMDPAIRENASMQEIKDTGRAKGVVAGALEAVVPAMMVGKAVGIAGRVGRGIRSAGLQEEVGFLADSANNAYRNGKSAGQGAITEFGTEAAQDVTGQVAENSLQREDLGNIDPVQAFNAGMAGAVAGGGMGAMGGAAQNITSALGTGADKVNAVRKDPVGAIADGITDLGAKAGTALAKGEAALKDKFESRFNEERMQLGRLLSPDADNESVGKDAALQHAQRVLAREDSSEESKKRAAELINNQLDWRNYRDRVTTEAIETRRSRMDDDLANEIAQRTGEGKQSRMSPKGDGSKQQIPASMRMDIEAGALGEERQQRIGNAADIFRKQGVPESLIKAGSALDTSDRQSAVATMGWVARGFTDVDGNMFVPEFFTRKHKGDSVKRIVEATKLAVDRGLLDAEVANRDIAAISDMAKKQWADQTNVFDTVFDAIPKNQFGRQWSRFEVEEFIPELRRMAQNGTTKREEEFLDQLFGSKENIAKAMSAFKEPTNESIRTDEVTPNAGESDELDYATKEKAKAPRLVGLMGGVDENATPFDTQVPSQRKQAEGIIGSTQLVDHPGTVGLVDHYTKDLEGDAKRSAQNDLLDAHGEEYLNEKQRAMLNAHGASTSSFIEGLHHNTRTAILNKINNRFRYVTENMEAQAEQAADKVYNPENFAEDFDARGDSSTVHKGSLFLETTGKTPFKTSAMRVLRHVWLANNKEQTTTNQAQGAHNIYQQLMQGLAALMESSDKFTGRVGYKTRADGEIKWFDGKDQLPKEFRLSKTTINNALKQMETARRSGEKENRGIAYAETAREKYRALVSFAKQLGDSEGAVKFANVIHKVLKSKDKVAIERLYTQIRNDGLSGVKIENLVNNESYADAPKGSNADREESSKYDRWNASKVAGEKRAGQNVTTPAKKKQVESEDDSTLLDKVLKGGDADELVKGTSLAADPQSEIYRNADGTRAGFADDALFGAVEGHAQRSEKADEKVSQADRTKGDKHAKQSAVDKAAQWAFDAIRKGVPAFSAAMKKMNAQQLKKLERGLKQISSMGVRGLQENFASMDASEAKKILFYATNAVLHLQKRTDLVGMKNERVDGTGQAKAVGRGDEVGRPEGASGVQAADRARDTTASELDAETLDSIIGKENFGKLTSVDQLMQMARRVVQLTKEAETLDDESYEKASEVYLNALNIAESLKHDAKSYLRNPSGYWGADFDSFFEDIEHTDADVEAFIRALAGSTQPATATKSIPMNYADGISVGGVVHKMRPEFKGKTTLELIGSGDRTASTRNSRPELSVGDKVTFIGRNGQKIEAVITKEPYQLKWFGNERDAKNAETWSKLEGWSPELFKHYAERGAWQFQYAAVGTENKPNSQSTTGKAATKEEKAAAKQELLDTLGDTVKVGFKKDLGGISGEWKPGITENLIQIALNSDVVGTARHESIHEFFNLLKKNGDEKIQDVLQRVATNKIVMNQLERLLSKHPAALAQIKADPEEAAAFMYQFWRAGMLKVGPQAQTFFEKVKSFLSKTYDNIRGVVRDERHAEMIMASFAKGAFKEADKRAEVVKALNELISKEQDVTEKAGKFTNKFSKALQLVYTAEGMIDLTKNKHLIKLAEMFNQRAGASMVKGDGWEGTYFDGKNRVNAKFQNQLQNILDGMEKEDVELVREALATGTTPKIERIEKAVAEMKKLNEDMMDYIDDRNISRLNEDGQWEKMQRRKDFGMPQIWDVDIIAKDTESFKADLIKHHMKELEAIAKQANAEIAAMQKGNGQYKDLGPAAKAAADKGIDEAISKGKNGIGTKVNISTVTPEMVADAIVTRVLMSGGKVDIEESTSELGITPLAASVNRRSLNWINPGAFDKYKQKDLLNIYSSYIAGMTKRGEYTIRFGHGGEVIRDQTDMAMLQEMGGDDLIRMAKARHPAEVKAWAKAKAETQKLGIEFNEPYPTLRMVGNELHKIRVGEEQFKTDMLKAAKELERAVKAIQAMEGTLGMDVSPAVRDLNSWLMTYQNVRLLPFSLFTSLSDVVGLTLNGGTLKDAWDAFVRGMREVKVGVINDSKTMDAAVKRAEAWGTVDAIALNDTIGQGYGSMFMSGTPRNISNKFFKKIGMESWNRAMRISASAVAERMISDWAVNGIDTKDSSAKARLERLYGEGADTKQIALDPEGHLDISDPANQAAVMRFVNDAVLRPNAAIRPSWASDPHYAAFFHLKSFTYAMHKTWLEAALNEARLGNYRPAMVLLSVYLPVCIAAGAAKEMLIPGDEPPWMKGGLDSYLSFGASKAGLLGVPQMIGSTWDTAFTDMGGPSVSQVRQALFQNPIKTGVAALPGGGTLQRYVE